jgi:ketosteroid isomerase-like protein
MLKSALLLIAVALAACAHLPAPSAHESVMQADREFAARARVVGLRAAFVEYAAADAVMFRTGVGPIRGREAIGEAFAKTEGDTLAWAPEAAEVAASGDLAYTWGWYTFTASSGKSSTGNYVSIWRRVDGRWLYIVDLGVPAPKP